MKRLNLFLFILLLIVLTISCDLSQKSAITIGATFPLSGDNATYGKHLQNAIELLKDDINSKGGIKGKKIKVVYLDDANEPKKAVSNLKQLVSIYKTPAVIGSAGSNCTLSMAPVANKTKTVIISPTSSAEALSHAGPFVFRTVPSDAYQGVIIAKWIYDEGHRKVGVFYVNNSWGVGMKDKFIKEFKKLGGEIVAVESGEELDDDFRTQLIKLKDSHPDALFMPTYSKQGGRVVKQARELGIDLPLYGADPWDVPEFLKTAGKAAEGVKFTVFDQYKGKEYQMMAKEYKKRYGEDPDFIAASGYDCLLVLSKAIEKIVNDGMEITGDNIRKTLHTIEVIGATGMNKFDENGDVVGKRFTRKIIKNGKQESTLTTK